MSNHQTGHNAELTAANHLKSQGFTIRQLNWRTAVAEIDIIAEHDNCLFFVEVKYRHTDKQGTGLDYITSRKLKQMRRAAELWLQQNDWRDEVCLAVATLDGLGHFEFIELS